MPTPAELPFIDSVAHYNLSTAAGKYQSASMTVNPTAGRSGLNGAWQGNRGNNNIKVFIGNYATIYSGFAYNTTGFGSNPFQAINLSANPSPDIALLNNGDGTFILQLTDHNGHTVNSTRFGLGIVPLSAGQWYYIEIGFTIGANTITASVRINNQLQINALTLTGTTNFTVAGITQITWTSVGGTSAVTQFCDIYVSQTGFYGDGIVVPLYPNGVGNYSQWTPNAAGNNYTKVNEHPPDGDTTYVSAASSGLLDSYLMGDMPTGPTVTALQGLLYTKKDVSGVASVKTLYRSGGVDITGQEFFPSDTNYLYFVEGSEVSLFTGIAWTPAEINAIEFGQKRQT